MSDDRWRTIEAALVDCLRLQQLDLDENVDSGDKLVIRYRGALLPATVLNITTLAKDLAERLALGGNDATSSRS